MVLGLKKKRSQLQPWGGRSEAMPPWAWLGCTSSHTSFSLPFSLEVKRLALCAAVFPEPRSTAKESRMPKSGWETSDVSLSPILHWAWSRSR